MLLQEFPDIEEARREFKKFSQQFPPEESRALQRQYDQLERKHLRKLRKLQQEEERRQRRQSNDLMLGGLEDLPTLQEFEMYLREFPEPEQHRLMQDYLRLSSGMAPYRS